MSNLWATGTQAAGSLIVPSVLQATLDTSVNVNGIYMRFDKSVNALSRFCRPVLLHNDHPVLEAFFRGSSFLVRDRGHSLMLFTDHQLGKGNEKQSPQQVMLIQEDNGQKSGLSPSVAAHVSYRALEQRTLDDILILEFRSKVAGSEIESRFFNFASMEIVDLLSIQARLQAIFAIGYLTEEQKVEVTYDEEGMPASYSVKAVRQSLFLNLTDKTVWDVEHRLPLKLYPDYKLPIKPDGLSGAPAFALYFDQRGQAQIGFAGIITEASAEGHFMLYEAKHIRNVINDFISGKGVERAA